MCSGPSRKSRRGGPRHVFEGCVSRVVDNGLLAIFNSSFWGLRGRFCDGWHLVDLRVGSLSGEIRGVKVCDE